MEFDLSQHLTSSDRERDYLRRVSERCITLLFPPNFVQNNPFRHLLREILACKGMSYSERSWYHVPEHGSCHGRLLCTKSASAGNLGVYFSLADQLSLFHSRVSKCSPLASKRALHLLKIFLDMCKAAVLKLLTIPFQKLPFSSCIESGVPCVFSSSVKPLIKCAAINLIKWLDVVSWTCMCPLILCTYGNVKETCELL